MKKENTRIDALARGIDQKTHTHTTHTQTPSTQRSSIFFFRRDIPIAIFFFFFFLQTDYEGAGPPYFSGLAGEFSFLCVFFFFSWACL